MARAGQTLEIPALGGRAVFRETAADTGGERVSFDFYLAPGKLVVQNHFHPNQTESFEVVHGTMQGKVGGEDRTVHEGESASVPAGVPHGWWNSGSDQAHIVVTFRPAMQTELMLETFSRLSLAGKVPDDGTPRFPLMAVLLDDFHDETRPAGVPAPILWVMRKTVAPIARRLGWRGVEKS